MSSFLLTLFISMLLMLVFFSLFGFVAGKESVAAMRPFLRILFATILLMLAAFSLFGFLASFEPSDDAIVFRVGYAIIGISSLAGVANLTRKLIRRNG